MMNSNCPDHTDAAFGEDTHAVRIEDFNWREIDEKVFGVTVAEDARNESAEAIARLFAFCWEAANARAAWLRFCAISAGLFPGMVARNGTDLAGEASVTKQNFSKTLLRCERLLGLKFSRSRSLTGRRHMAQARLRQMADNGRREEAA